MASGPALLFGRPGGPMGRPACQTPPPPHSPPGRTAKGAAAFWGRGQRPRPQNAAAPPPPLGFPPTPKRQRKSPAFRSIQPRSAPTRKKVVATASRSEGVYNRAGEPSEPFFGEEPRRNELGPGNLLPGPSGWSPRRRGARAAQNPPAAGYYRMPSTTAVARRSPPAQGRAGPLGVFLLFEPDPHDQAVGQELGEKDLHPDGEAQDGHIPAPGHIL